MWKPAHVILQKFWATSSRTEGRSHHSTFMIERRRNAEWRRADPVDFTCQELRGKRSKVWRCMTVDVMCAFKQHYEVSVYWKEIRLCRIWTFQEVQPQTITPPRVPQMYHTNRWSADTLCGDDDIRAQIGRWWAVKILPGFSLFISIWMIYFLRKHRRTALSKLLFAKVVIKLSNCSPSSDGKRLDYISNCQKGCQERRVLLSAPFRRVLCGFNCLVVCFKYIAACRSPV